MPKLKTNKSTAKRVRLTRKGKIRRQQAYTSHLATSKTPDRKRNLRKKTNVSTADKQRIKRLIPYS